ncbi:MAG: LysM peptidoglycan-binding domain-containing protein [Bacteroidota bacterium]|nr:LysM peptidoglycan-binding domain-containing protein [Bacteroidota bacterium]
MMKLILILTTFLLATVSYATPQDSIGNKVIDGKRYLMHKVVKGDGVYGLAKKYTVPASAIFAANEGSEKSIKIGQVLLIPRQSGVVNQTPKTNQLPNKEDKIYHTVVKGNTLSAIARQYNTTIEQIKSLNQLSNENIQLGQKLLVYSNKTNPTAPTVNTPNPKQTNNNDNVVVNVPKTTVEENTINDVPKTEEKQDVEKVVNKYTTIDGDEITESGIAIISNEGELYQERSFILHPTAKVGTIVMITNPDNNNAVFARVVGTCSVKEGIVLKMSKTVAHKLGISNDTQVKVSYAK